MTAARGRDRCDNAVVWIRTTVVVLFAMSGAWHVANAAPVAKANAIFDAQVAAIKANDEAALAGTFSKDAIVLVPDPRSAQAETTGLREAIARLSPHGSLRGIAVTKIVANTNASAVWWSAECTIKAVESEPQEEPEATTTTIRVTELATADTGWKVVAAAFAELRTPAPSSVARPIDEPSTTATGTLTPLSGDVAQLDAHLASAAVVFGTDKGEAAYDAAAAHKLLKGWAKLELSVPGKSRELHGKDWGFAITNVDWQQTKEKKPARMSALVIGTPTPRGGWQVVAVQYTAN